MTTSHHADIRKRKAISAIWLIPFITLCIGVWIVYHQWQNQGTQITISMMSAEGLEAHKTKVKARNVDIGVVTNITLQEGVEGVLVSVEINKNATYLLTDDAQIWVVSPRVSHKGISGLTTLLSGIYIELASGDSKKQRYHFTALESPPITPAGTPGLHITLNSRDQTSFSVGDTVIYKGLTVGQFEDVYFNQTEKKVFYNVFIKAPYHQLITANTHFWNVSGVNVDLSTNGINVQTGNILSLLANSITFDELTDVFTPAISSRSYFEIYPDRKSAMASHYNYSTEYIILISDTVRGLHVGAPVEYRGLNIGEVLAINYHSDSHDPFMEQDYKIPILISIQPGKIGLEDSQQAVDQILTQQEKWIKQGLRAKLQSGNLLTGKLFVNLQHYPDKPPSENIRYFEGYPIIPTELDSFSLLTQSSEKLLDKLNQLPLEELTSNAAIMITSFNETAHSLKTMTRNLNTLLSDANKQQLIHNLNSMMESTANFADSYASGSQSNTKILESLNNLDSLMVSIETLADNYSEGSEGYETLNETLKGLNHLMREMQPLLLELKQQPNSLIFSGDQPTDIQPKARK